MKRSNIAKKLKKLQSTRLVLAIVAVLLAAALVGSFFVGGEPAEMPAEPTTAPATTAPTAATAEPSVPQTTAIPVTTLPTVTVPDETEGTTPAENTVAPEEPTQATIAVVTGANMSSSNDNAAAVGEGAASEPLANNAPTAAAGSETTVPATEAETPWIVSALLPIRIVLVICLVADLAVIVVLSVQIGKLKKLKAAAVVQEPYAPTVRKEAAQEAEEGEMINGIAIGKVHNIGRRPSQQDSFGTNPAGNGILAVVADGMGGLSGGDKVSQKVVISMLCQTGNIVPGQMDGVLNQMVARVNDEVNRMLGPSGQYKSGSTLVSVLVQGGRCHWISVGDSRIYLYRGGSLIQLNHEHTYAQELMQRAMKGEISFESVQTDPQRDRLTSFIGMGVLKHIDASLHSLAVTAGDRLLLMSDGVFNTLPEQAMCSILNQYPDVKQAARVMEEQILAAQVPSQDNFTAVILGL